MTAPVDARAVGLAGAIAAGALLARCGTCCAASRVEACWPWRV
ncbi:MAG: hypothetical protein U0802_19155 [Candidatus Binatia bacterium]